MGYTHFKQSERYEISILLKKGYSHRDIAKEIKKNHSSVSREIARGRKKTGEYDPHYANHMAYVRRKYSKYQAMKIRGDPELEKYVEEKMKDSWTPEQIAGRLKKENEEITVISHVIIYKYLYSAYGQKLCKYLHSKRWKPKKRKNKKTKREMIPDRICIEQRPGIINERSRFGDFEGDTLGGIKTEKQTIAGLVERQSRYLLLMKISRLKHTMKAFKTLLDPYQENVQSLTLDNGVENKHHKELKIPTYFCHPYSSWEKGQIENSFQRLRRFIPKKQSLKNFSERKIFELARKMNDTPRKCLGYRTPAEVFKEQLLLST